MTFPVTTQTDANLLSIAGGSQAVSLFGPLMPGTAGTPSAATDPFKFILALGDALVALDPANPGKTEEQTPLPSLGAPTDRADDAAPIELIVDVADEADSVDREFEAEEPTQAVGGPTAPGEGPSHGHVVNPYLGTQIELERPGATRVTSDVAIEALTPDALTVKSVARPMPESAQPPVARMTPDAPLAELTTAEPRKGKGESGRAPVSAEPAKNTGVFEIGVKPLAARLNQAIESMVVDRNRIEAASTGPAATTAVEPIEINELAARLKGMVEDSRAKLGDRAMSTQSSTPEARAFSALLSESRPLIWQSPAPVVSETGKPQPPSMLSQVREIAEFLATKVDGTFRIGPKDIQAELRLYPPDLGRVQVEMTVGPDRTVRALFTVEHAETGRLLQQNFSQFAEALGRQGLIVEKIQVTVSAQSNSESTTRQENGPGAGDDSRDRQREREANDEDRSRDEDALFEHWKEFFGA